LKFEIWNLESTIDLPEKNPSRYAVPKNFPYLSAIQIWFMFDGPDYPKSLDEELFNRWLENGRQAKLGYSHLLIVWDEYESKYRPAYVESRKEIEEYKKGLSRERFIAAYDLYSESRTV
jgi:hypothetical protein